MGKKNPGSHYIVKSVFCTILVFIMILTSFGSLVSAASISINLEYTGCYEFLVSAKVLLVSKIYSEGFQYRKKGATRWETKALSSTSSSFSSWIRVTPGLIYEVRSYVETSRGVFSYSGDILTVYMHDPPETKCIGFSSVSNTSCVVHISVQTNQNKPLLIGMKLYGPGDIFLYSYTVAKDVTSDGTYTKEISIQTLSENTSYYIVPNAYLPEGLMEYGERGTISFHDILPPVTPTPVPTITPVPTVTPKPTATPKPTSKPTTAASPTPQTTTQATSTTSATAAESSTIENTSQNSELPTSEQTTVESSETTVNTSSTTAAQQGTASTSSETDNPVDSGNSNILLIIILGVIAAALVGIVLMMVIIRVKKK